MSNEANPLREGDAIGADYLVIGTGAMGMAFADTLLTESQASIVMVDRHDHPGGHWNDAYPFVRLHSASANYGVNSTPLGQDTIEQAGLSRGFYEQASAAEICSYFDQIMRKQFLPSGRVRYFPMCDYIGIDRESGFARLVSLASGTEYRVKVRNKIVDATHTDTAVPSRRPPAYAIAPGIQVIPPNALPKLGTHSQQFMVVGAGKTGIDTCLWLLEHDVSPDRITWIMPRDSWLLDRETVQPRDKFFIQRVGALALQGELVQQSESIEHLFRLLNENGMMLRINEDIVPPRFRCATVSRAELVQLRRIKNVVRLGHVKRIDAERVELERGSIATNYETIHIDCTSSGISTREPVPTFNGRLITLQAIRTCQQCFSAALIAHIELTHESETEKNRITKPIPLPNRDIDWLTMFEANLSNQQLWSSIPDLRTWIGRSRLDPNSGRTQSLTAEESALVQRFKNGAGPAMAKAAQLLEAR